MRALLFAAVVFQLAVHEASAKTFELPLWSSDKTIEFEFRARIEGEAAVFGSNSALEAEVGPLDNDIQLRRARISLQGSVGPRFHFKAETDISESKPSIKSVYAGMRNLPGNLRVRIGHVNEPFGLEGATSSRDGLFLERSLLSALGPSRNTGVLVNHGTPSGRFSIASGLFRSLGGLKNRGVGKTPTQAVTFRITGLPWVREQENKLALHVGLSYSHRNYLDDLVRFRAEPEIDLAPNFVDTGLINANDSHLLGLEFAVLAGPLSLQTESVRASVNSVDFGNLDFGASYVTLSWFATGEDRPYDRSTGRFRRVHPKRDFLTDGSQKGPGAWEVVLRYSKLDIDDETLNGGVLRGTTLGVNWYLRRNIRVAFNLVDSNQRDLGSVRMAGIRLQMNF